MPKCIGAQQERLTLSSCSSWSLIQSLTIRVLSFQGELVSMKQVWVLRALKVVLWLAREEEGIESEEGRLRKSRVLWQAQPDTMSSIRVPQKIHLLLKVIRGPLTCPRKSLGSCPAPSTSAEPTLHMPCLLWSCSNFKMKVIRVTAAREFGVS